MTHVMTRRVMTREVHVEAVAVCCVLLTGACCRALDDDVTWSLLKHPAAAAAAQCCNNDTCNYTNNKLNSIVHVAKAI